MIRLFLSKIKLQIILYRTNIKQLIRFSIIGVMNTIIDFVVFIILLKVFGIHYSICQVAGYFSGTINSFVWNKYWTFNYRANKCCLTTQISKFLLVNGLSLLITVLGLIVLVDSVGLDEILSKVIIILLSQVINFLVPYQ